MTTRQLLIFLLLLSALSTACGEGTVTGGDYVGGETRFVLGDGALVLPDGAVRPDDGDIEGPGGDVIFGETLWVPELPGTEVPGPAGHLGDPCEGNKDCESGFCVPSDIGDICTVLCMDDCPEGWNCKGVAYSDPDTIFVCMPGLEMACEKNGVCESGEVETQACGNCGTRDRSCKENCQWDQWSNCFGEGECVALSHEEKSCGNCGLQERDCTDECMWTAWSDCDGSGLCIPGEIETVPCGDCGSKYRTCTDACLWSDFSACEGSGECLPGASETQVCGSCGTALRICLDNCFWSEFGECTNEGSCSPGESATQGCGKCGEQSQQCTDECHWSSWGSCEGQGECLPGELEEDDCGDCGERVRNCDDNCVFGNWGPCLDEGICSPNETETDSCGNCGTKKKTCTGQCQWSNWGPCEDQGECGPDDMDSSSCGNCGVKYAFCAQDCEWGPWGSCTGQGVCSPGATQPCSLCGTQSCTGQCSWSSCYLGPVDGYEQNDSEGAAYILPGITDAVGNDQTVTANINPANDHDWYKISISDTAFHNIDPKFTITVPAGQTYKLCVTYDCTKSDESYSQCKSLSGSGDVSLDVGGCKSWISGDDDSGTATIQVNPLSGGSCSDYTLKIEA